MRLLDLVDVRQNGLTGLVVTIPKDIGIQLDLKIGDKLLFCESDAGDIIIKKNRGKLINGAAND